MNWTGGKLRNASKKGKSALITKQKQHFARARTNQQKGTTAASFVPSFFRESGANHDTFVNNRRGYSKGHQTKLEDYENVAPVAERLSAMGSGRRHPRTHLSMVNGNNMSEADTNYTCLDLANEVEKDMTIEGCDSGHGADEQQKSKGDLRRSLGEKGHSNSSQIQQYGLSGELNTSQASRLLEIRRTLLAQEDWVGLRRSRPPQVEFPSIIDKDMIGKRRKLTEKDYIRKAGAGERVHIPSVQGDYYMSGALPPRSADRILKIRVGDDALVSETSTTRSNRSESLDPQAPSDSMLMNEDDDIGMPYIHDEARDPHDNIRAQGRQSASIQEKSSSLAFQTDVRAYDEDLEPHRKTLDHAEFDRTSDDSTQRSGVHGPRKRRKVNGQTRRLMFPSSPSTLQPHPKAIEDATSEWANRGSCINSETEIHDEEMILYEGNSVRDDTWKEFLNFSDEGDPEVPLESGAQAEQVGPNKSLLEKQGLRNSNTGPICIVGVKDREEYVQKAETPTVLGSPSDSLNLVTDPAAQSFTRKKVDEADELWKQFVFGRCASEDSGEPGFPILNKSTKRLDGHSNMASCQVAEANASHTDRHYPRSTVAENGDTSSLLSTPHLSFTQLHPCVEPALSQVANASSRCQSTSNDTRRDSSSSADPLTRSDSVRSIDGSRSLSTMKGRTKTVFHKPRPFGARRSEGGEDSAEKVVHIGSRGRRKQQKSAIKRSREVIEDDIEDV